MGVSEGLMEEGRGVENSEVRMGRGVGEVEGNGWKGKIGSAKIGVRGEWCGLGVLV